MRTSSVKKWLINILIVVVVALVMVAMAEVAMRWIDGFRLSTIELQQNPDHVQTE